MTLCHAVVHFSSHGRPLSRWLLATAGGLYVFLPPSTTPTATVRADAITHITTSRYWDHIVCVHTASGPDLLVVDDRDLDLITEIQRHRTGAELPVREVSRYLNGRKRTQTDADGRGHRAGLGRVQTAQGSGSGVEDEAWTSAVGSRLGVRS